MFLDRSRPIRGGAADIYLRYLYALNTHLTNRNKKKHINEVFYSYRKRDPVKEGKSAAELSISYRI